MGYEEAIRTYERIYRKVDLSTILDHWAANTGRLNVYVHSPFCPSICSFCYYKGVQFDWQSQAPIYERYYASYLPSCVEPFLPMLETRKVQNYFFGGGTPSLMRPDTMRSVFALFPGFRDVGSKTFEVHPAAWDEEQLDVLAEHGFNCCIIGIQSFDESVLKRQHRIHAPFDRVRELAQQIRRRGMYVAGDLIYRMDPIDADAIFQADLDRVAELECDAISLQLNYDEAAEEEHTLRFFELIRRSPLEGTHRWEEQGELSIERKKHMKCYRVVRNEIPLPLYWEEIFPFINSLDEVSKFEPRRADLPSVIGFGSYRNSRKNTFSNLRGERPLEYIEVNDDWKPTYFVTWEQSDFFDECIREMERVRSLGPPPYGVKFYFHNNVPVNKEDRIYRRSVSQMEMGVQWDYSTPEIERYLDKLRELFPDWIWNRG